MNDSPGYAKVRPTQAGGSTGATRARYNRLAPIYDVMESFPERRFRLWRETFWKEVTAALPPGGEMLEVGVGTGKNLPYWPKDVRAAAVDLSPAMIRRARRRVRDLGLDAPVTVGDVQQLEFRDDRFDLAAGTFVFCSVPDPLRGLEEMQRVVKPGGWIFLLEHVRSADPVIGRLMDLLNPVVVRVMGANINRDTVGNVERSGLERIRVEDLGGGGIFKLIRARIPVEPNGVPH